MARFFNWFKRRTATSIFAFIAFFSGFFFLNQTITGNVIVMNNYSFSLIPLIGVLLFLCSLILIAYSIKK